MMPPAARPLNVAYVMQNVGVGVNMAYDVGQTILIKNTIGGLAKAGQRVSVFSLWRMTLQRMDNPANFRERSASPLGLSGNRLFQRAEGAARRVQAMLRLPYLAVVDSFRFYEGCLRALPEFDLCHEYAGLYSVGAAYACRRLAKPYIITADADLLLENLAAGNPLRGIRRAWAIWSARLNYRLADKIICVSEAARQNLATHWQADPAKIAVIPNGVDLELFSPRDGAAARAELNLPGDAPVVMFVGGFQPWHGLEHLLDAFAQVEAARPDARLVLVGDGPAREAVTRQARALRLNGCLHITGSVPHARVPQLLAAADVVAAPYPRLPREMWFSPLKLYEYMAAGKAIVATDEGQIRQAIQDGENGLLVPPGDASSLAAAITQLVQDPARRAQLGQTARRHAVERHSWERHIDRLIEVYRTVL